MRWLWLALTAGLWSEAGFMIAGALPYTSGSAFLCVTGLLGGVATGALALIADEKVRAQRRTDLQLHRQALKEHEVRETERKYRELRDDCVPLATAPSVSGGTLTWSYTPVKGPAVPPLAQLAQVSAQYRLDIDRAIRADTAAQWARAEKEAREAAERRMLELEKDEEYVPSGQEELSASVLEYMAAQVEEAADRWDPFTEDVPKYHWRMSPEWAAEVRKLKGPVIYPVKVSGEYGVPELTLEE